MSSFARPVLALAALAALLPLNGCYQSHDCGHPETCNYEDDDCDGVIDNGFVDATGRYTTSAACGACGVVCGEVFPTAAGTECVLGAAPATPFCRITSCRAGTHLVGTSACEPDVPSLCLTCTTDGDCALREPGARCLPTALGASRCAPPCGERGCAPGFACTSGVCVPSSGVCACGADTAGATLGCLVTAPDGHRCAGLEHCDAMGLSTCTPALTETCNAQDDDCNGVVDEGFFDAATGLYLSRYACGACGRPCTEPGPHMVATCVPDAAGTDGTRCDVVCEMGWVDVDRIAADGCECHRYDGTGPPPVVGGDSNCDGVPDDTDRFIYVTPTGSDADPGTLLRPMRSVQAALGRGRATGKDVLVAGGTYDGAFDLVAGVSIFGGYAADFTERDVDLHPVTIVNTGAPAGSPVLTCHDVHVATRVEGFTLRSSDATLPGGGSTALLSDRCGPAVSLSSLVVLPGRGAPGVRGPSSSDHLRDVGLTSLAQLDGVPGAGGSDGTPTSSDFCGAVPAGAGGAKACPRGDVGGGRGGGADCRATCTSGARCGNAGCTDYTVAGVCDFAAVLRDAVPNPAASPGRGAMPGAAGELTYNAPTDRFVCNFCDDNPTLGRIGGEGADGASGGDGLAGSGCPNGHPRVDLATGLVSGGAGTDATGGGDGSGGGGGSAGAGYLVEVGVAGGGCTSKAGGSGGGGGSGGCGAPYASGGTGGGASVGVLVSVVAGVVVAPTFDHVRIDTESGGGGGDGGIGAEGGTGASGAPGGMGFHWCARSGGRGGDGGRGGASGGGGGGCGGDSHGVLVVAPVGVDTSALRATITASVTVDTTGVPGAGGMGGFSAVAPGSPGAGGDGTPVTGAIVP